jgi:glycosyltransferase involved in cell wall biosynthesis
MAQTKTLDYSIILPTIGRQSLKKVLEGILKNNAFETFRGEILVVFDGEIQKNIQAKLPKNKNISYHATKKRVYAAGARNQGLKMSRGKILIFLGDDTIPEPDWLEKTMLFHQKNPLKNFVLLGKTTWTPALEKKAFHQWLLHHGQFDFGALDRGKTPNWRHFYTSNLSLKRSFLSESENEKSPPTIEFFEGFQHWGFEDTEFGYRLSHKKMRIFYDAHCLVKRCEDRDLFTLLERTRSAAKNAEYFEKLHPEVKIRPRGLKHIGLCIALPLLRLLAPFSQKINWWYQWKKAWISPHEK